MIAICGMLIVGMFLSAFFSGSETGFYRAGRIRLAMDARQRGGVARALLWMANNPSWFVATALVGNNFANYLTSLAIVLVTHNLVGPSEILADLIAPIVAAPFVFVYGELLPKSLFFMAPNRMLRASGPLFVVFAVLFVPISCVLWALGLLLQYVFGESHLRIRQRLARNELQRILDEGHHAGILEDVQRRLAQSVFEVAQEDAQRLCISLGRVVSVSDTESRSQVIQTARRYRVDEMVVRRGASRNLLGYVRLADVLLSKADWRDVTRPLVTLQHDVSHLSAVAMMQSRGQTMSEVVDANGRTIGVLPIDRLLEPLLQQR